MAVHWIVPISSLVVRAYMGDEHIICPSLGQSLAAAVAATVATTSSAIVTTT